jgi:hypothetical protein
MLVNDSKIGAAHTESVYIQQSMGFPEESRSNVREPVQIHLGVSLEKNFMHVSWFCARPDILRAGDIRVCRRAGA